MNTKDKTLLNRMPTDLQAKQILRQNAQRLARMVAEDIELKNQSYFIRVSLGDFGLFDISRQSASEVIYSRGLARVPFTPSYYAGVVSLHGEMIGVLDLPAFFGVGSLSVESEAPVLVVKGAGIKLGLLLDDIEAEVNYDLGKMEPAMAGGKIDPRFVTGIHEAKVTVLDMDAILVDVKRDKNG